MKKLFIIICASALASCSPKVGGEIYFLAASDSTFTVGAKVRAVGTQTELASKADSLAKGYPVWIAGQWFQVKYTATEVELNTILNFKTK